MDLSVNIAGKKLTSPICAASGVIGFGEANLTDMTMLGAIFTKAVTPEPRAGNVPPRLAETDAGLINAIGLANPGLTGFLKEKVPILQNLPCPTIVNVAGATQSDYVTVSKAMNDCNAVWGIELNVSCPNVDHGGMAFGTDPGVLEALVLKVRKVVSKPLIVKLSPNTTDIVKIAEAAAAAGADALSCINTVTGMKIDIDRRKPVIPRGFGGLSGPAIRPIGVAAVWRITRAVDIPVFGTGGISCSADALEYFIAGASAIQIGTALFANPEAPSIILSGVREYMDKARLTRICDLWGK